jgi:hypothetical protein
MVIKPIEDFEEWFRVSGKWWADETDPENPTIHVQGDVKLKWQVTLIPDNVRLPYTFGEGSGNFDCHGTGIQDLTGSPRRVGGNFYAGWNQIPNLAGGPAWVGGDYNVQECVNLTHVSHVAHHVGGLFVIGWNKHIPLLKPFINSEHVTLMKPPQYNTWDDIHDMQLVQTVFDQYKGEGRAGALKVAGTLIKMGYPSTARM